MGCLKLYRFWDLGQRVTQIPVELSAYRSTLYADEYTLGGQAATQPLKVLLVKIKV